VQAMMDCLVECLECLVENIQLGPEGNSKDIFEDSR
jgi:hypothetical protein